MRAGTGEPPPFETFRGADAPLLTEHGSITPEDVTPAMAAGFTGMREAGNANGTYLDVPYSRPGMSLTRLALKSGAVLPLHTHDCDCLYYVAAGGLTIGTETLGAGDGFFVGSEVPYGYVAGPEGAIVLEFRSTDRCNIRFQVKTATAWDKLTAHVAEAQPRWAEEALPELR